MTPWKIDFRQVEPGPMRTTMAMRVGQASNVILFNMSRRVHQTGAAPPDAITFGIVPRNGLAVWQSHDLSGSESRTLLSFGGRNGFDCVSNAEGQGLVLSFQAAQLHRLADALGTALPEGVLEAGLTTADTRGASLDGIRQQAQALLNRADLAYTPELEETLALQVLSFLTARTVHNDKSDLSQRSRAVQRAIDCMANTLDDPMLVADLCTASGASWRTLDRGFKERFGIGPKQYYTMMRLRKVRESLLQANHGSIADAANRWGFWHMGQLAKDYAKLFGERPSQTQRRPHYRAS